MEKTSMRYWYISSILNLLMGGKWPETLSSRCYRNRRHWWFAMWCWWWNWFFSNESHCKNSYKFWRRYETYKETTRSSKETAESEQGKEG